MVILGHWSFKSTFGAYYMIVAQIREAPFIRRTVWAWAFTFFFRGGRDVSAFPNSLGHTFYGQFLDCQRADKLARMVCVN